MFATLAVTILLAAAPGTTGASGQQQSTSTRTMCAKCAAHHASAAKQGWGATRRDNPHSTVVEDESTLTTHSPTNDEINAAETGNTYSTDFRYATAGPSGTGNLDLEALEAENPHNAQPGMRVAVAVASTPAKCDCIVSDSRRPPGGRR